jgi:myo-inositol-1(or 4)-monophosphatase
VSQACAGIRRPGAAALDLCYVAAGYLDGFFETGLSPWDAAAGSLMITEAGGLIGNFTGESDFLYQRELVAGNPRVYAQLVTMLAPYTKMIDGSDAAGDAGETGGSAVRVSSGAASGRTTIGGSLDKERTGTSAAAREDDEPTRFTAPDATSIFARSTVGLNDVPPEAADEPAAEPAAPRKPPTRIKKADFVPGEPEPKPQNRR